MKKFLCMICLLLLLLGGCGKSSTAKADLIIGESLRFTDAEIEAAMEVAMTHFREEFVGCSMTRMEYIESRSWVKAMERAQHYGAEEAIILFSDFEVTGDPPGYSMHRGDTYRDWSWILTRDDGGEWILRGCGAAP